MKEETRMDQIKTGRFIAIARHEHNLTQAQLSAGNVQPVLTFLNSFCFANIDYRLK